MGESAPSASEPETGRAGDAPLPREVRVLGATALINDIASEMIYPLLPGFLIGTLGGDKVLFGLLDGLADTTSSLVKLKSGAWSDRLGARKGFILAGYLLAALSRPLTGLATAPWHAVAARVLDRLGKGIRSAPRDALIAAVTRPEIRGRAFGFHRAMDHLGAAIGPVLATHFLLWRPDDLRTLFLLTLIPGLAVVALVMIGLREPAGSRAEPSAPNDHGAESSANGGGVTAAPLDRSFKLYLVALLLFSLGNASDGFLLLRAGELGVPLALLPLLWGAFHVVKSGANLLAGRWADRLGSRRLILLGWVGYALIYLALGLAEGPILAWTLFLQYGFLYALTEPAEKKLVAELADPRNRGRAFGWFNFTIGIAALPSSLLFGFLYQRFGALAAFGTGAGLALTAAVLLAVVTRSPPRSE